MKRGYTLIELMVAVFIVGVLCAIAVPVYTSQLNKSQIASAITTLGALEHAAKVAYEENPSNTSIQYNNVTLNNNTVTAITASPVINALYIYPGGNASVTNNQFLVCVYVGSLNFNGYVAPTAGTSGTYARICKQVTASDPIYTNMCGSLQGNTTDVPITYLPTGCNCANIWAGTC